MTTESFIASLRTVSKDLAFWAQMEINLGATLEQVIARIAASMDVVELEKLSAE